MKKTDTFGLNYYRYMIQPLVLILSENTNSKKNLSLLEGNTPPLYGESIAPIYTKITNDLTIILINKCFEFQNNWLKMIRIRYKCMQICPMPLC